MNGSYRNFLGSAGGVVLGGALIGLVAAGLELLGNPPNMGICVVCFERDIAGALGLHRAAAVQYLRPEVPCFVLGALLAAWLGGGFRSRSGSAPLVRFFLGAFAAIGALVFLGCTWRLGMRLAGLDGTALLGLAGLLAGIGVATWFEQRGYSLGPSRPAPVASGLLLPGLMLILLGAVALGAEFGSSGALFESAKGPGALHATLLVAVAGGLAIGALAQQTGFCTVGWARRSVFYGERRLLLGLLAFVLAALALKAAGGAVKPGFEAQPVAHSDHLWNFLGMLLAGLAFTMAGGCPGRQLVAAGEGNADAGLFVLGSFAGAAAAHDLAFAAIPDKGVIVGGPGPWGEAAVLLGIAFCALVGFTMKRNGPGLSQGPEGAPLSEE
jgi:YedE family putative selenium metabolism protein